MVSLAKELQLPISDVKLAYEDELERIKPEATVNDYLPLFASRRARAKLATYQVAMPAPGPTAPAELDTASPKSAGARVEGDAAAQKELVNIARLTPDEAMARLGTSADGLLDREADERLERFGLNEVAHEAKKNPLRRFVEVLFTPLGVLLLVSCRGQPFHRRSQRCRPSSP